PGRALKSSQMSGVSSYYPSLAEFEAKAQSMYGVDSSTMAALRNPATTDVLLGHQPSTSQTAPVTEVPSSVQPENQQQLLEAELSKVMESNKKLVEERRSSGGSGGAAPPLSPATQPSECGGDDGGFVRESGGSGTADGHEDVERFLHQVQEVLSRYPRVLPQLNVVVEQ
ncbi:hypothetical protein HK405_000101, partial [Cladochytrium tenue]